jgi:hypothetical protein
VLRLLTCASAVCVLAAGAGIAAAVSRQDPREKAAALERLASVATTDSNTEPAAVPGSAPHPIPARMLGSGVPVPVSPSVLQPHNGWLVSDGRTLVAVYAGAAGDDRSTGRVVVVRQNLVAGRQTIHTVNLRGTGAFVITAAPLGRSVETSAQTGRIHLRTNASRAFYLDLGTGTLGGG